MPIVLRRARAGIGPEVTAAPADVRGSVPFPRGGSRASNVHCGPLVGGQRPRATVHCGRSRSGEAASAGARAGSRVGEPSDAAAELGWVPESEGR
ncbi:hypothetical protein ACFPN7_10020 [Amycolatopsis halotolerans]|uniref:hypothetical protein n=1 Tax=Amycolatopsis halotolerans TaxID=330083 RepID=UPI0036205551